MSLRQNIWANKAKARLHREMGGVCWCCGVGEPLEVDHIDGRDYSLRKLSFSHRISRYRREWTEGKIQLLCPDCNRAKVKGTRYPRPEKVEVECEEMVPF